MIKDDQYWWLANLLEHFEKDPASVKPGFETNYLTDLKERLEEEGTEMFLSGRMMEILIRIGSDRYGMHWDEFKDSDV